MITAIDVAEPITLPDTEVVAASIVARIRQQGSATLADIKQWISETGIPAKGSAALCNKDDPNIIFWVGFSQEALAVVYAILDTAGVEQRPISRLAAFAAGPMLNMPMVNRPPKAGYTEPHWLPTAFVVKD